MKRLSCPMLLPHRGALPLGTYCERNLINAASASASLVVDADRKSTRLNSSHLVISYAVFCLKKKKIKHTFMKPFTIFIFNTPIMTGDDHHIVPPLRFYPASVNNILSLTSPLCNALKCSPATT